LALVTEAKNKSGTDRQWATEWFRNYLGYQSSATPLFVMLATPDMLYLWKRTGKTSASEPTATADSGIIFSSYLRNSNLKISSISGPTFELIVGAWLDDLSHGFWQPSTPEERHAFADSGLIEAVENGRVVADVAA
jgi:hypothetical protein